MLRRAFEEQAKYRKENPNKKRAKFSKLEGCIMLLPIIVIIMAFGLMFFALKYQVDKPVLCPLKQAVAPCHPESVTIAVIIPKHTGVRTTKAIETWIKVARNLGMRVIFFGPDIPDLPSISINSHDEIDITYKALDWLNYRYGGSPGWFFIVKETTFVHPYYLMTEVLCYKDPSYTYYVGERGNTPWSEYKPFAASGPGFLLSTPTLNTLVANWRNHRCTNTVAADVSIADCLRKQGITVEANGLFMPKIEHHYFKPLMRLISSPTLDMEQMDFLIDRFFTSCGYL